MANRKTFSDFATKLNPQPTDYVVGFDHDGIGGEKRFPFSHLKNFVKRSDIVEITTDITLPVNQLPTEDDTSPPVPNLNGKIFHVNPDLPEDIEITLPQLTPDDRVRFEIVNLMETNHVKLITNIGTFMAKGDVLAKKYHTTTVYFDGVSWHGFGDLLGSGGDALKIKEVTDNYRFVLGDIDTILHFVVEKPTKVTLPNPTGLVPGSQFYITNLSESSISLIAEDSELKAKASKLRRQYDDAVVYTDGKHWYATGDLL